jgi:hypothetical protein
MLREHVFRIATTVLGINMLNNILEHVVLELEDIVTKA